MFYIRNYYWFIYGTYILHVILNVNRKRKLLLEEKSILNYQVHLYAYLTHTYHNNFDMFEKFAIFDFISNK